MRFSYRAVGPIAGAVILALLAACSRTQQDWRVAQQAGTPRAYEVFAERHPDSELAGIARQRVAQLTEEAAWQQATRRNTAAAYQEYLAKYPHGSWSQDARIRMQSRSMAAQAPLDTSPPDTAPATLAGGDPVTAPASPAAGTSRGAEQIASAASRPASSAAAAGSTAGSSAPTAWPSAAARPAAAAAQTAPAVHAGTAVTKAGRSAVQLGAFSSIANADSAWTQLSSRFRPELQGLSPQIEPVMSSGRRLYRLETRVADEAAARQLCRQLQQHLQGCLPVP